jgi:hypothetical protein
MSANLKREHRTRVVLFGLASSKEGRRGVSRALARLRVDQAHGMTEVGNLARPVMGAAAGRHRYYATRQVGQKRRQLRPAQPLAQHRMSSRIGAVEMEHALGQIDTQNRKCHRGSSRLDLMSNRLIVAHTWPVSEPGWVHPISNPPNPPYPHKEHPTGESRNPRHHRAAALMAAGK